ncbi:MAG: TolC family protein [Thermoflexibacteraceae bacterium]
MKSLVSTYFLGVFLWAVSFGQLAAQNNTKNSPLDTYLDEALSNNEGIRQQQFSVQKSLAALQEAKGLFLPQVTFGANYTLAGGGRTIDFPLGDLFNPVYSTLNQLTQSRNFPQLANQNILLNPNDFYDARFRTSMPLYNVEIQYNLKIKKQQVGLQTIEINLYKRELVKEVKKAYWQYAQALQAIRIYENAQQLVAENKRINESLLANGKANRTAVVRADNELVKIEADLSQAKEVAKNAQAYFNFLLNKPLDTDITVEGVQNTANLPDDMGIVQREELRKLSLADSINQNVSKLSKSFWQPKLNTFFDLGSQGFNWKVNDKTAYYLFGVSLEWNVFSGGRNKQKIKQANADIAIVNSQKNMVTEQLKLQLTVAQNNYKIAVAQHTAAVARQASAEKYYGDVQKMYKQGQVLYIELLDAQNQVVTSQLQSNITKTDIAIKLAELERAAASYDL